MPGPSVRLSVSAGLPGHVDWSSIDLEIGGGRTLCKSCAVAEPWAVPARILRPVIDPRTFTASSSIPAGFRLAPKSQNGRKVCLMVGASC